jgi:hypothetical protein
MPAWMLMLWYAACAIAGPAVLVLAGVVFKFATGSEGHEFNVALILIAVLAAVAPLLILYGAWISGGGSERRLSGNTRSGPR